MGDFNACAGSTEVERYMYGMELEHKMDYERLIMSSFLITSHATLCHTCSEEKLTGDPTKQWEEHIRSD